MSSVKNPDNEPSMLDKLKNGVIENKKIIITIVVVGIVLGLVYYFTTKDSGIIDNDEGVVGCPICENPNCANEKAEIKTLKGQIEILEGHKERLESRIATVEKELDDSEDALARKTRDFIGSTVGLTFATIFTGFGVFFITRSVYSGGSAKTPTTPSTTPSATPSSSGT